MANLRTIEINTIQSIREMAIVYQTYEYKFTDEIYVEINNYFIQPMIQKADALMNVFDNIGRVVNQLKEKEIIIEEES